MAEDFEGKRLCPILQVAVSIRLAAGSVPMEEAVFCDGPRCAWYDQTAERCAVLSIARNK